MKKNIQKKLSRVEHLIIIGAMKSGTTSLYEYLSTHSRICRCKTKEPNFFIEKKGEKCKKKEYRKLWKFDPDRHKYLLEASTGYTKYPFNENVPENIERSKIEPKFIYIVRNPIDRIESHYNFLKVSKSKEIRRFTNKRLVEVSKYFKQMERFWEVFPDRKRYLIVDFKNMLERPKYVLKKCKKFLDLEENFECGKKYAQNKTPSSKMDLWISKLGWLKNKIGSIMSEKKRRGIKKVLRKISPKIKHREIGSAKKMELKNELQKDMKKFKKEFGFDVGKWDF